MSGNPLAPQAFLDTSMQPIATGIPARRPVAKAAPAISRRSRCRISLTRNFKVFPERRSSQTQRVSLAATPHPAKAKAAAGDRVTMIARLICWLAIGIYLAVLSVQLFTLYAG